MLGAVFALLCTWLVLFVSPAGALVTASATLVWAIAVAIFCPCSWPVLLSLYGVVGVLCVIGVVPIVRRCIVTSPALSAFSASLPAISDTEQAAIDAGGVWWDAELFSGNPSYQRLLSFPKMKLSDEEKAFLANEVEELCRLTNDWMINEVHKDLPPELWQFIKEKGFLGLIIPKKFGGKGFSAAAHSEIVHKVASRSPIVGISVMVPNSLGPAELLLHYGTKAQQELYLPRLAQGLELPAFALTGPLAGSDAAAIPDFGIVCRGLWEDQEVLGMRLTWNKRYITLGPVCTLLGLAFRLYDPDHLIGSIEDVGITCVLLPTHLPGVQAGIGRRHNPLSAAFQNGPTHGQDVFVPLEYIVGGRANAGCGWRMLVECLSAGRGISLPALAASQAKLAVRGTGGYSRIRHQFRMSVSKFEGVEEKLAEVFANAYLIESARRLTCIGLDLGEKPTVVTAIMKYNTTELVRVIGLHSMDVQGGKGICMGPSNFIGRSYQLAPVSITVEGANIVTRSLMIFGQGAIRCHPYVMPEIQAARAAKKDRLRLFDRAFFGHIRFVVRNFFRSFWLGWTGSCFSSVQVDVSPHLRTYYKKMTYVSSVFALLADLAMFILGGTLKRRESLSARLGDVLSQMYLISAVLKRYEDDGRPASHLPIVRYALDSCFYRIRLALSGFLYNFPRRWLAIFLRLWITPFGSFGFRFLRPHDSLNKEIVSSITQDGPLRDELSSGIFWGVQEDGDVLFSIDCAMRLVVEAERITKVVMAQKLPCPLWSTLRARAGCARDAGIVTIAEYDLLIQYLDLHDRIIRVDDFPFDLSPQ